MKISYFFFLTRTFLDMLANSYAYHFPHISYIISRGQDYLGCHRVFDGYNHCKKYLDIFYMIYDTEERE